MWDLCGRRAAAALAVAAFLVGSFCPASAQETVQPSTADPQIRASDAPNLVYGSEAAQKGAPLVVFMPGTHGTSVHAPDFILRTVADQGYRVIFLSYDDEIAGTKLCQRGPPDCFARFRTARLFGGGDDSAQTPVPEAIVPRLVALLRYLDREHPGAGWSDYLTADGPAWPRIVVSGLSQGAGMAAFLAKRYPVRRVVLFSSPWDFTNPGRRPASWLFDTSATPPDRWWVERHVHENTTALIAHAYQALRIPADHILLFDGPKPPDAHGDNPFHGSTIRLPQYVPQWRTLFGSASAAP